ncbi:MAG: PEP-CTERM sorting domain-containing protein [Armatimonadota bacterium]|nr:PEP-CTERM sorting domain-containing protein [bacterium]
MRIIVLVTVITLMFACMAPAFAGGKALELAAEPLGPDQIAGKALELADDVSFEIKSVKAQAPVERTSEAIQMKPTKIKSLGSVSGRTSQIPKCQVIYTTQSSNFSEGFTPGGSICGAAEPPVPEPASILALATGIGGILLRPRSRRKK